MTGKPYPKDASPVWVEIESYAPTLCSDFADKGPWIPSLPADYTWLVHPQANVYALSGGGGAPNFRNYVVAEPTKGKEEKSLQASITPQTWPVHKAPYFAYLLGSPGEFGDVFYRDAARILAGKTVYANVSEDDPDAPNQRKRFGFTRLADHKSAHHFIGVINE